MTSFLWQWVLLCATSHAQTTLNIHTMNSLGGMEVDGTYFGRMTLIGHRLALADIQASGDILTTYDVNLITHEIEFSTSLTNEIATNLTTDNDNDTIPFVLGPNFSSMSMSTNEIFSAADWSQMSSLASSPALSNSTAYPTYYRTMSSDSVQGNALVRLCNLYEWDSIAVLYVSSAYGTYLNDAIQTDAALFGISVSSFQFDYDDQSSIENAITQFGASGANVAIIVAYTEDADRIFTYLNTQSMLGSDYFYLGVDAWLDAGLLRSHELEALVSGYVGTYYSEPAKMKPPLFYGFSEQYQIWNQSQIIAAKIEELWNGADGNDVFNMTYSSYYALNYGWDSMMALGKALHIYDQNFGLTDVLNNVAGAKSQFRDEMYSIITEQISFYGATGNVTFDSNGDRSTAIIPLVQINATGHTNDVGWCYRCDEENVNTFELTIVSDIEPDLRSPTTTAINVPTETDDGIEPQTTNGSAAIASLSFHFVAISILFSFVM